MYNIWFSLSDLPSLCMTVSRSIRISTDDPILFLWLSDIPLCVCVCVRVRARTRAPHLCPSLWWSFSWLPCAGYCKWCSSELGCKCLFESCFSLGICPVMGLLGHMVALFFVFLRNLHPVLHSGCTSLYSQQQHILLCFSQMGDLLCPVSWYW